MQEQENKWDNLLGNELIVGEKVNREPQIFQQTGAMSIMEKLEILTDSAKYDVSCSSSGVER